ncbi:site-specific integrase [Alkalihalobacillus sp. BA299]|uniref:tyrosine-type recombinase/integrase n=1 Tax=Alkalihalobacillus sp. BA299 TaxID=2815938 RepID=UPI001ADA1389|nr:site-specific integrase [Alkalihalobacillus sp. BA299]
MPYGYSDFLLEKNKSPETIDSYVKEVNYFFAFLDFKHKRKIELYEITTKDIKDYLEDKKSKGSKTVTINKYITILKNFFDFLWTINKIPFDPSSKIKRIKEEEKYNQELTYQTLLDTLPKVLNNREYSPFRKVIYILALYGLRASEFQILKDNVSVQPIEVEVVIKTKKRKIALNGEEAEYFMEYYYNESMFNLSNYVFVTNKHNEDTVPVEGMTIYTHLRTISEDYDLPKLVLNDIRHAYAHYLYREKQYTIEDIATEFGIEENSAALLVDSSMDRIEGKVS